MTETTLAPPVSTPNLNKALAAVQAQLPAVTKDSKATIPGKDGKQGYKYNYADLTACSKAILPLLGKNGLAFTSKPTMLDGKFVLVYALRHESGESDEGIFPLPGNTTPQGLGSFITYYRRYALCAVTGLAPQEEDDDAGSVNHERQQYDRAPRSAGEAFQDARPAPVRQQGNGGQVTHPAASAPAAPPSGEPDADAQPYADEAHVAVTSAAIKDIHVRAREAHKLSSLITNPATQGEGGLGAFLNYRRSVLEKAEKALDALEAEAQRIGLDRDEMDAEVLKVAGVSVEAAGAEDLDKVTAVLAAIPSPEPAGVS